MHNPTLRDLVTWLGLLMWPVAPLASATPPGLPLDGTREIEFETDEGTWISLDVSPDGQTIVFDLLGDLYSVPITGGHAAPLTSGMAFDSQPRFSPDGQWIAFISDAGGSENLWIARPDGSQPRRVSADQDRDFVSPDWTPGGARVLVSRGTGGTNVHEVWAYDLAGGEGEKLLATGNRRENYLGATLSPDERYLYYAQRRGSFSWDPQLPIWSVVRRDQATKEDEVVVSMPGSAFSPRLSHDGTLLAYGTRVDGETGLRIRDLESDEERWLKYPIQHDDQESRASRDVIPGYAFTPDDAELVLSYGGKIWRLDVSTGDQQPVPFTASVSLDIGPRLHRKVRVDEGPVRARLVQWPQLSPDGRRLVFAALGHLYAGDSGGGEPRRLTRTGAFEFQPTWSPDGRYVAYVTWTPSGGHLWKLAMDGHSEPERVSEIAGFYLDPAWSPDGSRIAALFSPSQSRRAALDGMARPRPQEIVWLPATGGKPQRVAASNGVRRPHFADDPERIFVTSTAGLQSLALDGTQEKSHLKVMGKGFAGAAPRQAASDLQISPDGRHALALVNKHLYLVALEDGEPEAPPAAEGEAGAGEQEAGEEEAKAGPPVIDVDEARPTLRRLSDLGADDFAWGEGGKTIVWSLGASVFRQSLASAWAGERPEETAVDVEAPRDVPRGSVVLRGARLVTMRGDEVIESGDVVVVDNRIVAVGPSGEVEAPAGAAVFDVTGKTIVPGFIDVHAHWNELLVGPLDRQAWPLWVSLAYGVTATRDPQSRTLDLFLYSDLVESGEILGPRLYTTGPGLFSDTPIESYDDAVRIVRRFKESYRTHMIKVYALGDRRLRQWILEASREYGLMPTAEGAMDLKLDLTHAIDGFSGNEHALPVAPLYRDVVQLFARSEIFYTPTLVLSYGGPLGENYFFETTEVHSNTKMRRFVPHPVLDSRALRRSWYHPQEYVFPRLARAAAQIAEAGGKVCVGGHGEMQGLQVHWEMWALGSGGMPSQEVLRAATLNGAEALGLDRDLGSIEVGKLADLVILDRNPLADIRHTTAIRWVMKNGRLYDGDTLEQLWPNHERLPEPWWWRDDPARLLARQDGEGRGEAAGLAAAGDRHAGAIDLSPGQH